MGLGDFPELKLSLTEDIKTPIPLSVDVEDSFDDPLSSSQSLSSSFTPVTFGNMPIAKPNEEKKGFQFGMMSTKLSPLGGSLTFQSGTMFNPLAAGGGAPK